MRPASFLLVALIAAACDEASSPADGGLLDAGTAADASADAPATGHDGGHPIDGGLAIDVGPEASADAPFDASASDAARCPGENPALQCRALGQQCIPSSCGCTEHGWACTADCGGGRLCGDAGAGGVCTPGADQTCNDDPTISSLRGRCLADRTCACGPGASVNPTTGRCR